MPRVRLGRRLSEGLPVRLGRAGRLLLKLPEARMKPWEWWKRHGRWDDRAAKKWRGRVGPRSRRDQRKAALRWIRECR